MYARDAELVEGAERLAEAAALEERLKYRPFLEAAERYAQEAGLVVGGESATRLLLGAGPGGAAAAPDARPASRRPGAGQPGPGQVRPPPVRFDSFTLALQGSGAPEHANQLARRFYALAPEGLGHYTAVFARPGGQFAISVDGRDLVTVEEPPMVRELRATAVLAPSRCPAQFASADGRPLELACVGPELRLLSTYAALCDPARAGDWKALLAAEAGLRALMCGSIRAKLKESLRAVGGAEAEGAAYLAKVLGEFAPGEGRLLVGAEAVRRLGAAPAGGAGSAERRPETRGNAPAPRRLQFVTEHPLAAEQRRLAALAAELGLDAQGSVHNPHVPGEPRLRRLTIHLQTGGRRVPVIDVFDTGSRELVPFVPPPPDARRGQKPDALPGIGHRAGRKPGEAEAKGGRRRPGGRRRAPAADPGPVQDLTEVPDRSGTGTSARPPRTGTVFVLFRFRLIDLWTVALLVHLGAAEARYGETVLFETLADFTALAAHYERMLAGPPEQAAALLMPETFIGRAEDAAAEQKMAALRRPGSGREPYLPARAR